mgnify:CR=1 FL=1
MAGVISSLLMFRVLVTDSIQLGDREYPEVELDYRAGISRQELLLIAGEYDALITRSRTQVDDELLSCAPRLRVIGRGGVGVDNIDLDAASRRGIVVVNAPEANNVSAAELAIALMLAAARGLGRSDRLIRSGTWDRSFLGREIQDSTLGVVGLGRIGSIVTRRAQGLGMKVVAFDPYISRRRAQELNVELVEELDELLVRARFLTVHTPLTEETGGMIGARELALLPPGAVVVNAARGGIIAEDALAQALASGHLFAAGVDVFTLEPPGPENPLLHLDNVVLTAHLGANTQEAQARVGEEILERTVMALAGDYSRGVVNAPALAPDVMEALGEYLQLGESLGRMVAQLLRGRARHIEVEFSGEFPIDPDPIAVAVVKGFLEPILTSAPNYVNALAIARDRDIRISRTTASRGRGYTRHVLVTASSDDHSTSAGGTVMGDQPRIVNIEGYPIEIRPEGTMLICTNYYRPGAIGRVGTVLGEEGINISSMQLSKVPGDGLAMFALTLDQVPETPVLERLRAMEDVIRTLRAVRL